MEQVLELAKNVFVAAHVSHNDSNRKAVNILGYFFVKRQSISAKEWVWRNQRSFIHECISKRMRILLI